MERGNSTPVTNLNMSWDAAPTVDIGSDTIEPRTGCGIDRQAFKSLSY